MSELLDQLHAGGALEARGRFTLDSEKAREKLRQYQLADPHRYVLLLVEAMTLAGARKLEFSIDADDVRLRCFCRPFSHAQLVDLYGSLFVEVDATLGEFERSHLRGLQQLAYALNSAMALNPRFIEVESVDVEGQGVALVLAPERPDRLERITGEPGTRVHVRDRFRPGLLVEFFRSVGGKLAEQQLLRRHCRWSPIAIELDGEAISGPLEFEGEVWHAEPIVDEGKTIGRAAIHLLSPGASQPGPAFVELVCNGVWIERVVLDRMVAGFAAIVDDDRLRRDVSQTNVLRDAGFDRVVRALRESEAKLVARLAERRIAMSEHDSQGPPAWAEVSLREWLSLRASELAEHRTTPQFAAVAKVPLWRAIGGARLSTATLLEHDPIHYSHEFFEFAPSEVPFVVDLVDDEERELFAKLFPRARDHAPALRRELERDRQRKRFATRTHVEGLPDGYYLRRESLSGALAVNRPLAGELGLRSLGNRESWVRLVREGCLLQEIRLEHPIPGLCAVLVGEFAANDDWDRAQVGEELARAALELLRALERMLRGLAESGAVEHDDFEVQELLRAYVRATCDRQFVSEFLAQFGFDEAETRALLRKLDVRGTTPDWRLDTAEGAPHPLASVPLYVQAQGHPLPLAELLAWRGAGRRIAWLDHDVGPLPQLERPVVLLQADDRLALRSLFGGDEAFERHHDRVAWLRRREQFMALPARPLGFAATPLARVALADPRFAGELGLREFTARTDTILSPSVGRIRASYRERPLADVELELPLPGLLGWVDGDALDLDADFQSLARAHELRPALLRALPELVGLELDRAARNLGELRRCELWFLLRAIALAFGDEGLLAARLELAAAGRLGEWIGLVELLGRWSARELERALGRLRGRGELPTRAALERELGRGSRNLASTELELAGVRLGLAGVLERGLAQPLVRAIEGTRASTSPKVALADLLDALARQATIAWVPEGFRIDRMPEAAGRVLVLDPIEQRICAAMFGAAALEDVSAWLVGRASFEARRRVDEVRLPARQALIQIAIDEPGVRGELGLVRESPAAAGRSRIRVFHLGRSITSVDLPAEPLALLGALEFDALEVDPNYEDLAPAGRERVRSVVARHAELLLTRLIDHYPQLAGPERSLAAELLRRVLVSWPPGSGGYAARAKRSTKRFAQLADLALFPGARRPWTASELAEAARRSSIATIDARVDRPLPEGPVIVLERGDLLETLEALFGRTRDLAGEWARRDELERIKAAAPRLPEPPLGQLGTLALAGEGLSGRLWWAPGIVATIALGREGRTFATRAAPDLFPCAGALEGSGVRMNEGWTRASLERGQEQLIDRGAHDLWAAMIDEFERLEAEGTSVDAARRAGLREALRGQFLRLHAGHEGKRGGKAKRKARGKTDAMFERLWTLKILALASGHHVSPEIAARERPIELASLRLWQGPSAEEVAQRAAAERKQAEQRRLAELEARREQTRERRRSEQAAAQVAAEQRRRREQAERERAKPEPARAKPEPRAKSKSSKPAPTREQRLLEAIRDELRVVRAERSGLLGNHHLESLVMASAGRGPLFAHSSGEGSASERVQINADHPLVVAALEAGVDDPARITLLASAVYTFLNLIHTEITDEDEAEFLRLHAAHAASLD
ncbi:hypothetical protein ACNOYE_00330 [Nannocystaceae bacterium ST9]